MLGSAWEPQQGISGSSYIGGTPPSAPRVGDNEAVDANEPPEIRTAPVRMVTTHALPVHVQMTSGTTSSYSCVRVLSLL